jgi:hypothetical protein
MPRTAEQRLLALILLLNLVLGVTYALVTPAFEASDELWHYPMVRHLADGNPLPVQVFDPAQAGPWNQEASQPPLYYYLGAALTWWVDTSDMETARWLNPHVDNGVITPDGNTNLAIHDPAASPWQGTLLAVRIVRLFSVLLGTVTVYLTYRLGREVAPDRPEIALGAAAINAFLPMFLFISGAVNNDNLAIPLASLALLIMVRNVAARRDTGRAPKPVAWLALGAVIGLAVLTKEGTLGLLPMAFGTAVVAAWQAWAGQPGSADDPQRLRAAVSPRGLWPAAGGLLLSLLLVAVPILVIAGWWYYRNIVLYGDWLGWNAFIAVLGERARPASLLQLWGERRGFLMSFWGLFGGVNVPMAGWTYLILNGLMLLSVIGFLVYLVRVAREEWLAFRASTERPPARLLRPFERRFALIACLLFSAAVVYGLVQWATTTWSSQGRLVFTALSPLLVLMSLGLAGWLPRRPATAVLASVAGFMFVIAALAPWVWIRPAYQPPTTAGPLSRTADVTFGDALRLVSYDFDRDRVLPGGSVRVRLEWEALSPMDRDWSVFVHLYDPVLGQPIAQRDMYPGQGLVATRLLEPGDRLVNEYVLSIPPAAVAPAALELAVGLYDLASGERLPATGGGDAAGLATIKLESAVGDVPNPVTLRFEHDLTLSGFMVAPRRVRPGDIVDLTAYWRAGGPLPDDYTFFAQIVGPDTTRYAAADMAPPVPTSRWVDGETYSWPMTLAINPATPSGTYPLIVGLYVQTADGGFERLQRVTEDGRLTDDFATLTPIRVD